MPVFVQRIVAAKIGGANSFSGSSRPKSRVRRLMGRKRCAPTGGCRHGRASFGGGDPPLPFLPSREEKEASPQPRAGKFVGYMSGAKRCLFLFSGSSRRKSGVCFCPAARRGENRVSVFVQRVVAAKIGGLFLFSGSSRRKSGACFCSAGRRGQNRGCEFVQRVVAAKIGGANSFSGASRPKSGVVDFVEI